MLKDHFRITIITTQIDLIQNLPLSPITQTPIILSIIQLKLTLPQDLSNHYRIHREEWPGED